MWCPALSCGPSLDTVEKTVGGGGNNPGNGKGKGNGKGHGQGGGGAVGGIGGSGNPNAGSEFVMAVARTTATGSTGTQTITSADMGGETPKAALFFYGQPTADDTVTTHANMSIGACDSSSQWAVAAFSQHGIANSNDNNSGSNAACILLNGGSTINDTAVFSAFVENGVTINWTVKDVSEKTLTVVLFGGGKLDVDCGVRTALSPVGTQTVTTGFRSKAVFCAQNGESLDGTLRDVMRLCFGFAAHTSGGSADQAYLRIAEDDGESAGLPGGGIWDTRVCGHQFGSSATGSDVLLDAINGQGFDLTSETQASGHVGYLALGGSIQAKIISATSKNSTTGNKSFTGVGFTPTGIFHTWSAYRSGDENTAIRNQDKNGSFGLGVVTANVQSAFSLSIEDDSATTDTSTITDDVVARQLMDDGSDLYTATFVSLDSDGMTYNFTTVDTFSRLGHALCLAPG